MGLACVFGRVKTVWVASYASNNVVVASWGDTRAWLRPRAHERILVLRILTGFLHNLRLVWVLKVDELSWHALWILGSRVLTTRCPTNNHAGRSSTSRPLSIVLLSFVDALTSRIGIVRKVGAHPDVVCTPLSLLWTPMRLLFSVRLICHLVKEWSLLLNWHSHIHNPYLLLLHGRQFNN